MNPDPPGWESLPAELRKRLPKRKKKMKEMVVNYNFIHHLLEPYAESIRDRLQRPNVYDPMVARISFAIAFLYTHAIHTRRLRIFTK
jgi:malonyl CoA-acyl carrier protein transacylase